MLMVMACVKAMCSPMKAAPANMPGGQGRGGGGPELCGVVCSKQGVEAAGQGQPRGA